VPFWTKPKVGNSGDTLRLAVIVTNWPPIPPPVQLLPISGAFYFPNGPIYMSGAATLHDTVDASACLELIGSTVTATAGTAAGSTCAGLGSGSTGTTIGLVK